MASYIQKSKIWQKWTYLGNRLTAREQTWSCLGEGEWEVEDWEFGVSRFKVLYIGGISNKMPPTQHRALYSVSYNKPQWKRMCTRIADHKGRGERHAAKWATTLENRILKAHNISEKTQTSPSSSQVSLWEFFTYFKSALKKGKQCYSACQFPFVLANIFFINNVCGTVCNGWVLIILNEFLGYKIFFCSNFSLWQTSIDIPTETKAHSDSFHF